MTHFINDGREELKVLFYKVPALAMKKQCNLDKEEGEGEKEKRKKQQQEKFQTVSSKQK